MSRSHHKKLAVLERRSEVAALYQHGLSQQEIAQRLDISAMTVRRDLEACRKQWRELQDQDMRDRQAEELAKIDYLERQAWQAWKRSRRDAETLHVKQ
jgi:transposase